jgi:hypothetical protein
MQIYQEGLLRKATALSKAVKRGLIEALSQISEEARMRVRAEANNAACPQP